MSKVKMTLEQFGKTLNEKGLHFLKEHPLFNEESDLPKTAEALKRLARQVNDGLISVDEANQAASDAVEDELNSFSPEKADDITKRFMTDSLFASLED